MKFVSILLSTLLSVLLLFTTLRVSLTFTYYKVDPAGFIERLCENKDKPELKCNGKCHLKKVTQQTDSEQKVPNELLDIKDIVLYYQLITSLNLNQVFSFKNPELRYLILYEYLRDQNCFHPPKLSLRIS